jgi:hypothetical protein
MTSRWHMDTCVVIQKWLRTIKHTDGGIRVVLTDRWWLLAIILIRKWRAENQIKSPTINTTWLRFRFFSFQTSKTCRKVFHYKSHYFSLYLTKNNYLTKNGKPAVEMRYSCSVFVSMCNTSVIWVNKSYSFYATGSPSVLRLPWLARCGMWNFLRDKRVVHRMAGYGGRSSNGRIRGQFIEWQDTEVDHRMAGYGGSSSQGRIRG